MSELRKKRKWKELKEWIIGLIVVVIVAFIIRTFVICPVAVKGISMEPNFHHGDIVLVDRISYRFSDPKQNDVVICDYESSTNEKKIIKRVIGVPGDTIEFEWKNSDHYVLIRNSEEVDESYIKEEMNHIGNMCFPYTVEEDKYFVMGDNRNESVDSRFIEVGAVDKRDIVGKVFLSVKPFGLVK